MNINMYETTAGRTWEGGLCKFVQDVRPSPVPLWWAQRASASCHRCSAEADSDTAVQAAWPLPSCSASNIPAPSGLSPCRPRRLLPTHTQTQTHMHAHTRHDNTYGFITQGPRFVLLCNFTALYIPKRPHCTKNCISSNNHLIRFLSRSTGLWTSEKDQTLPPSGHWQYCTPQ